MEASIDCTLGKGMFESERTVTFRNSDDKICTDLTQCFDDAKQRAMVYIHQIDNEDNTMLISFPNRDGGRRWVCKSIVHPPIKGWWTPEKLAYEREPTEDDVPIHMWVLEGEEIYWAYVYPVLGQPELFVYEGMSVHPDKGQEVRVFKLGESIFQEKEDAENALRGHLQAYVESLRFRLQALEKR